MDKFITGFNKSSGCITNISSTYTQDMIFHETFQSTTITCIDPYSFQGCTSSFVDLRDTKITYFREYAFQYSNIGKIILPETLKSMANNIFLGSSLETLNIPASTTISIYTFNFAYIGYFTVDSGNPKYSSEKGFIMDKDKTAIIAAPRNITSEKDFPYFTRIGGWSMSGATLKTFTGNSDFSIIDYAAFHGLKYLELLDLSKTSVKSIPNTFTASSFIKYIVLPTNLEVIRENAFNAIIFKMIIIPQTVSVIENCAFNYNATFTVVYLGSIDYSNNNIFSTLDLSRIKVYVTDLYKEDKFGHINVNRNWIYDKRTCQHHRHTRNTFSLFIVLCIFTIICC